MYIAPLWNQILSDLIHCYIFQVLKILDDFLFVESQIVASQLETADRPLCIVFAQHVVFTPLYNTEAAMIMTSTNSIPHLLSKFKFSTAMGYILCCDNVISFFSSMNSICWIIRVEGLF